MRKYLHAYMCLWNGQTIFIKKSRKPAKWDWKYHEYCDRSYCAYEYNKATEKLEMGCFPEVYADVLTTHFVYLGRVTGESIIEQQKISIAKRRKARKA